MVVYYRAIYIGFDYMLEICRLIFYFFIQWISWYFFSKNWTLYCLAFFIQVLQAFSSILQFSIAVSPYIIRFILLTKPIPQVTFFLKVLSKLLIKKKKSMGKRGNFYGISIITIMGGLQYPLKTNRSLFLYSCNH